MSFSAQPHTTLAPLLPTTWEVPSFTVTELSPKQQKYCIVIPVINEDDRILKQLQKMKEAGVDTLCDIIIADGGSTDGSMEPERLASLHVRTLLTKTDKGKLSAQLRMAYAYALQQDYAGILTIDGNGKDGIDAVARVVEALENGYEFVQASRFVKGGKAINTPLERYLAVRFIHAPITSLGAHHWFTDTTNGFRGYSARALKDERVAPFRSIFDTYELIAYLSVRLPRLGYKTIEVPATRAYPNVGPTPTKIHRGAHASLVNILFKAVFGGYNPR